MTFRAVEIVCNKTEFGYPSLETDAHMPLPDCAGLG